MISIQGHLVIHSFQAFPNYGEHSNGKRSVIIELDRPFSNYNGRKLLRRQAKLLLLNSIRAPLTLAQLNYLSKIIVTSKYCTPLCDSLVLFLITSEIDLLLMFYLLSIHTVCVVLMCCGEAFSSHGHWWPPWTTVKWH